MSRSAVSQQRLREELESYWVPLCRRIDAALERCSPVLFNGSPPDLQEAVLRSLAGGKRVRCCVVCLVCEALGGTIDEAMPRTLAIECVHAASLLHDDFVDADRFRRNRPAEWTIDGARRAVLLADVMFSTAIAQMVELSAEDGIIIAQAISAMARGAYEELHWREHSSAGSYRRANVGQHESYDALIAGKTGSLFAAAARLGARAAHASAQLTAKAHTFGALLGDAYQIADDRADLYVTDPSVSRLPNALISHFREVAIEAGQIAPATKPATCAGLASPWELATLDRVMSWAIAERVDGAVAVLDAFPANRFTRLLRALPGHCLDCSHAGEV